jgi:hypothetical protein
MCSRCYVIAETECNWYYLGISTFPLLKRYTLTKPREVHLQVSGEVLNGKESDMMQSTLFGENKFGSWR